MVLLSDASTAVAAPIPIPPIYAKCFGADALATGKPRFGARHGPLSSRVRPDVARRFLDCRGDYGRDAYRIFVMGERAVPKDKALLAYTRWIDRHFNPGAGGLPSKPTARRVPSAGSGNGRRRLDTVADNPDESKAGWQDSPPVNPPLSIHAPTTAQQHSGAYSLDDPAHAHSNMG